MANKLPGRFKVGGSELLIQRRINGDSPLYSFHRDICAVLRELRLDGVRGMAGNCNYENRDHNDTHPWGSDERSPNGRPT